MFVKTIEILKNMASSAPTAESGRDLAKLVLLFNLMDGGIFFLLPLFCLVLTTHCRNVHIKFEKRENAMSRSWEFEMKPYVIPRARLAGGNENLGPVNQGRFEQSPNQYDNSAFEDIDLKPVPNSVASRHSRSARR